MILITLATINRSNPYNPNNPQPLPNPNNPSNPYNPNNPRSWAVARRVAERLEKNGRIGNPSNDPILVYT